MEKAKSHDIASFTASHIKKLSGDNTHEEKERVILGLRTLIEQSFAYLTDIRPLHCNNSGRVNC